MVLFLINLIYLILLSFVTKMDQNDVKLLDHIKTIIQSLLKTTFKWLLF